MDYEIPALRAEAGKLDQQLQDAERRGADYLRLAGTSAAEYRQACALTNVRAVHHFAPLCSGECYAPPALQMQDARGQKHYERHLC